MQSRWLFTILSVVALLLATMVGASAQGDRFVGVRKDVSEEVILFSIDALTGTERRIATLHKADANVQLLGLTALNARRGTFSYAYTDRAAGKDFLHTVSAVNGPRSPARRCPPTSADWRSWPTPAGPTRTRCEVMPCCAGSSISSRK